MEDQAQIFVETIKVKSYKEIKQFILNNIDILSKTKISNPEIKYILKQKSDNCSYVAPEVMKDYFMPIIAKCVFYEKNMIPPSEWLDKIIELPH